MAIQPTYRKRLCFHFSRSRERVRVIAAVAVALLLNCQGWSQEMLGVVNGYYAGVNTSVINPAGTGSSPFYINVNVAGGDLFVNSNYLYVHHSDYSFGGLFRVDINDPKYEYIYQYPEFGFTDTLHYLDYFKNNSLKRVYVNARVLGLSAMIKTGRHAFSVVSGIRNNLSVDRMPYNTANFIFRGLDFVPQQGITYSEGPYQANQLSWIEIGAGYAYTFRETPGFRASAGITIKTCLGLAASYAALDEVTYNVPNNDSVLFEKLDCTFGLALPVDYNGGSDLLLDPLIKGSGFALDAGIVVEVGEGGFLNHAISTSRDERHGADYRYRLGISILDAGWIRFNNHVEVHDFTNVNNEMWAGLRSFHARSISHFLRSASYSLLGDSSASLTSATSFRIYLPAALSIQADYNFGYNLFANLTFIQGIRLGTPSVRRATLLAVTPRYETRWYAVHLPLSLVDFRYPQIGLAVRLAGLTVGTEKLGTFLKLTDVKGLDLYFALTFNINQPGKTGKSRGGRSIPCDTYENYDRYRIRQRNR
jgi:hypothetical protein